MSKKLSKRNGAFGRTKLVAELTDSPLIQSAMMHPAGSAERSAAIRTIFAAVKSGQAGTANALYSNDVLEAGSPMEAWMAAWKKHSTAPAELAFWLPFQQLSHLICLGGGYVRQGVEGGALSECWPNLYVVNVADPARGKGAIQACTREAFGVTNEDKSTTCLPGSHEMFLDFLQKREEALVAPEGFVADFRGRQSTKIDCDEYPKYWKAMKADLAKGPYVADLLKAYNGEKCELAYLKNTYCAKQPILSCQFFGQEATIMDAMDALDFSSGFIRRCIFIWSPKYTMTMSDRHKYEWPQAINKIRDSGCFKRWNDLLAETPIIKGGYTLTKSAEEYLGYHLLKEGINLGLEDQFIGTLRQTATKFALIYHVMHGRKGNVIDKSEAMYAIGLIRIVMHHLQFLLDTGLRSRAAKLLERTLQIKKEIEDGTKGGVFNARRIVECLRRDDIDIREANILFELASLAGASDYDPTSSAVSVTEESFETAEKV